MDATNKNQWIVNPSFYPPLGAMLTTLNLLGETKLDWDEIEPDAAEAWSPNHEEQVYQVVAERDANGKLLYFTGRLFDPQPDAAVHDVAVSPQYQTINEAVKWCDGHADKESVDTATNEALN